MRFDTRVIHSGYHPDGEHGPVTPPIYQTSTFLRRSPTEPQTYEYARESNPTRTALEQAIAALEGAEHCRCFASGMAAMDAVLKTLRPGNRVLAPTDLYGGTYSLFRKIYEPFGLGFDFVDMTDTPAVRAAITPDTRLVWMESPGNPMLRITDIRAVAEAARERGIPSIVDNTFASPYLQRPLELGADLSLHSTTKYLGGHSDAIGGAVAGSDPDLMAAIHLQAKTGGAIPGPMDSYLILRGLRTLHVRMDRAMQNAQEIAQWLQTRPEVGQVVYPGLETHPQHGLAGRQMGGFGAMITFSLREDRVETAHRLLASTRLFLLADSLGGVESLINHPVTMSHGSIPPEMRLANGLTDSMIRLSVGIEDVRDLLEDLEQAIRAATVV